MRKFLATILITLFIANPVFATDWTAQAKKLKDSILYVETKEGSCSSSVIDTTRHYVLTAAHCDGPEMFVDQTPAKVVAKDVKADLLVVETKATEDHPALKLATKNPQTGQEVATYGYGYGLEQPLFRTHHVSENEAQIPELPYRYVFVDTAFLPGQSGGPIVDLNMNIVGIVQRGNETIGLGVGAEIIKSKMGKYFEK
jgi:S1-C subfamily serine protease